MPSKSNHSDAGKGESSANEQNQRGARSSRTKTFEKSSGSGKSTLDPKRNRLPRVDENDSQAVTGQLSGDVQKLSPRELSNSESVEELVEEGQDLEGELIEGIENVPSADQGDVKTHGSPEPEDATPPSKNRNRL